MRLLNCKGLEMRLVRVAAVFGSTDSEEVSTRPRGSTDMGFFVGGSLCASRMDESAAIGSAGRSFKTVASAAWMAGCTVERYSEGGVEEVMLLGGRPKSPPTAR